MKPARLLLAGCGIFFSLYATGQSISNELQFARYLVGKKNYEEALYVLKAIDTAAASAQQTDSIYYLLGNLYYDRQDLPSSILYFDQISNGSTQLRTEGTFFSAFNNAYLRQFRLAKSKLTALPCIDSLQQQLKNFELAGIALLERKLPVYDSLTPFFEPANYLIDKQEQKLMEHRERIVSQPKKSPAVAALLSVVIPGAGKFYAGNKGQGVYTLIIASVLGLQTWEGYQKAGPKSFRFIAYGTLFTSLYVGTIWGSAFAVKFRRDQLNETIDSQILFDMHIPIRTLFH